MKELKDKMLVFMIEMNSLGADYSTVMNHIEESVLEALEEYAEETGEFSLDSNRIRVQELSSSLGKSLGRYNKMNDIMYLSPYVTNFYKIISSTNRVVFETCIEVVLHEARHRWQYLCDNVIIAESIEHYLNNTHLDKYELYHNDPAEIDAVEVSRAHVKAAYEYIMNNLGEILEERLDNRKRLMAAFE